MFTRAGGQRHVGAQQRVAGHHHRPMASGIAGHSRKPVPFALERVGRQRDTTTSKRAVVGAPIRFRAQNEERSETREHLVPIPLVLA